MKKYAVLCVVAFVLFGGSCATKPKIEKPQFTYQHFKQLVLLDPSQAATSPEMEVAISLVQMEFPVDQAEYVQQVLYGGATLEDYKEEVLRQQRERYRDAVFEEGRHAGKAAHAYHWYYSETTDVTRFQAPGMIMQEAADPAVFPQTPPKGMILERNVSTSTGGVVHRNKQYINIDLVELNVVKMTDFFVDFQEDTKLRDIIYDELRKLSKLQRMQPLSQGIYFSDNPELTFNFFITDEGLGLHWAPEQIAPYSSGDIQVILPWQVIRPLMLYTGIELLVKFNIYLFM